MKALLENITQPDNIAILVMIGLVIYHTALAFGQAVKRDRRAIRRGGAAPVAPRREARVHTWPFLLRIEFLAALIVTLLLIVWSLAVDAPLEEEANPSLTPNPAKAPWYFLGLQEMLVYFDPWIAGVVVPILIIIGLMAIPYLDVNPKGSGYYTIRERKWAVTVFSIGFFGLWLSLIVVGVFFRGPGWLWFSPWQEWDRARVVAQVNVDLPEVVGIAPRSPAGMLFGGAVVAMYYAAGLLLPYLYLRRKGSTSLASLGLIRYASIALLLLTMIALPLKMALRLAFNIKYVWITPWFNV